MAERITGHRLFVSRFFHAAFILLVFLLFYSEETRGLTHAYSSGKTYRYR